MKTMMIFTSLLLLLSSTPSYSYEYEEMDFEIYSPCSGNAYFCYPRIMARGYITDSTPDKFQEFLVDEYGAHESYDGVTICLDSPGGSVIGGMTLGRLIRAYQIATCISDEFWSMRAGPEGEGIIQGPWIEDPMCASACALVFLGGRGREARGDGELLGVHQFRSDIGTESTAQVNMTIIGLYFDKMGISRRLLDISSITPHNELTWLYKDDLVDLGVVEPEDSIYNSDWSLVTTPGGDIAVMIYQDSGWDWEINKRVSFLAYIYKDIGGPAIHLSIFPSDGSSSTYERLRLSYIDHNPRLTLKINEQIYAYENANWMFTQDGAITAAILLPSVFSTYPESIEIMHLYAELPEMVRDVRLDVYLAPSEYATYIRAALR